MKPFYSLPVFALGLLAATSASAQWTTTAGAGLQHMELQEFDTNGRELVREHGWMPGAGVRATYAWQTWQLAIDGSTYRRNITYDGQLQNGTTFVTDTDASQDRLGIDAAWRLNDTASLVGGVEWEHRNRRIHGQGSTGGLDERSTSWRLLAGGKFRLAQFSAATVDANAQLVFAQAEHLRVRFDQQIFDDVSFSTKPAVGLRTAFTIVPVSMPKLSATLEFDWMRVRRSDGSVLSKNGLREGSVAQPEHRRRTLAAFIAYRFD
jgi:hypothetical protein